MTLTIDDMSVPHLKPSVFTLPKDGKLVAIKDDVDDFYFTMDGLTMEICLAINGVRSLGEIRLLVQSKIPKKYHLQFGKDFSRFIQELVSNELIDLR